MAHKDLVSPSREYEITMYNIEDVVDIITTHITLPDGPMNNVNSVRIWYQKYIPEGWAISGIHPFEEAEELNPEYVGIGNELDYVGPEEDLDGFTIHEIDDTEEAPKDEA